MFDRTQPKARWKPHELTWIEAANSLGRQARKEAIRDISEMSPWSYQQAKYAADKLRKLARKNAKAFLAMALQNQDGHQVKHLYVISGKRGLK